MSESDGEPRRTEPADQMTNASVIGRLLEEISWEGTRVKQYRLGGRGRENVLTAEVLYPLSLLPRGRFLGEIVRRAHGADTACSAAADEIENAAVTLLPDESRLGETRIVVQPDATIVSPSSFVLVEAKRIRSSRFQREQLARELLTVIGEAEDRTGLLLLILASPPPFSVEGLGRVGVLDAIRSGLSDELIACAGLGLSREQLLEVASDSVAWTTWPEVRQLVSDGASDYSQLPADVAGTIRRLVHEVVRAIDWHG